jgi:hypothetical protein
MLLRSKSYTANAGETLRETEYCLHILRATKGAMLISTLQYLFYKQYNFLSYIFIFRKRFYFVFSGLKLIGQGNPDNNLESPYNTWNFKKLTPFCSFSWEHNALKTYSCFEFLIRYVDDTSGEVNVVACQFLVAYFLTRPAARL